MFYVTTNQLTKAVTGIDYKSGPHAYKKKKATDADSMTPVKVTKTATTTTPSMSQTVSQATSSTKPATMKSVKGHPVTQSLRGMTKHDHIIPKDKEQESDDTLSSSPDSSDSESLPKVSLTSMK